MTPTPVRRARNFSNEEKKVIEKMKAAGVLSSEIGRALDVKDERIRQYLKRKRDIEYTGPKVILKKYKMDIPTGRAVEEAARERPSFGVRRLVHIVKQKLPGSHYHPGRSQIQRYLKKKGYVAGFRKKSCPLTPQHKIARIAFATKWLALNLGNVLWSDETMVRSHPHSRKLRHRYSPYDDDTAPQQTLEIAGKNSVMFWGMISQYERGPLVSIGGKINGDSYRQTIDQNIIPEFIAAQFMHGGDWKFMHDNAPVHTKKSNVKALEDAGVNVLTWPARSPDLNPIENVWAWLKEKLYTEYPPCESAEELETTVHTIWNTHLTPELCEKFCGNYSKRLRAVLESKGESTKY
jgi:transposase